METLDYVASLENRQMLFANYNENRKYQINILRRISKSYGTKGGSKYRNRIKGRLTVVEKELKRIKTKMILLGIDTGKLK
jgi:hypothetical protein